MSSINLEEIDRLIVQHQTEIQRLVALRTDTVRSQSRDHMAISFARSQRSMDNLHRK